MISAIITSCNEYPQVLFTVQNVLSCGADEVVLVSNKSTDKTNAFFQRIRNKRIKLFIKDDILSHWQAKNLGIEKSNGDLLFFLDAHCILGKDTLQKLAELIKPEMGAVHSIIHYLCEEIRIIYDLQPEFMHFRQATAPSNSEPFKVPIMSTCGMMVSRKMIDELGGWNTELGIYGGGEPYICFKHGVCGFPHYVHPDTHCWHYAEKRGYCWNSYDYVRNELLMAYCVGSDEWLNKMAENRKKKERPEVVEAIVNDVREKCKQDRDFIKSKQIMSLNDYFKMF